jgi:hypothetical protein
MAEMTFSPRLTDELIARSISFPLTEPGVWLQSAARHDEATSENQSIGKTPDTGATVSWLKGG